MRWWGLAVSIGMLLVSGGAARAEALQYKVVWPSGVNLGTARMESTGTISEKPGAGMTASMLLDASFPGVPVTGEFLSRMDGKGCTLEFEKKLTLALRKVSEKTTVAGGKATRKTGEGGGESVINVDACAHDALAYLQSFRRELKAGRVPKEQTMLFGARYAVKAALSGTEKVTVGSGVRESDRYTFQVKGPASESEFEILFARDEVRTPVQVRVTMAIGKFRLELVP